jgi:acetate---CoA ligase (ADP-forming)
MSNLARYSAKIRRTADIKEDSEAIKPDKEAKKIINNPHALSEYEAKKVLGGYGIPVTREVLATSADMAVESARQIGYPVALKVQSAQITHKTEAGGIKLNVAGDAEVRAGFKGVMANAKKYMPKAKIQGVLVQEMLKDGVEVIIGTTKDPVFGHVIMFGLGGIFVEALKDVSFRITPLNRIDAEEMVSEIKGYGVLQGIRGKPPVDLDTLVDIILKVSRLVTDYGDTIKELDINPLMLFAGGAKVADALIIKK